MPAKKKDKSKTKLSFEDKLWKAADKLRGHLDAAEYKHVVLGLIFLKYISDVFEARYQQLQKEDLADPEDRDEYVSERIFWMPEKARWSYLQNRAKTPEIGSLIDGAI
jgi:type I restriction enzyme M protein